MVNPGEDDPSAAGRIVLAVFYLSMLCVCFLVPIFFYLRVLCQARRNRRLVQLEIATVAQVIIESQTIQRRESIAARQKYQDERRARLVQLFAPVRMILADENFVLSDASDLDTRREKNAKSYEEDTITSQGSVDSRHDLSSCSNIITVEDESWKIPDQSQSSTSNDRTGRFDNGADEEERFILIPEPGLSYCSSIDETGANENPNLASNNTTSGEILNIPRSKMRRVAIECPICLCDYQVGSDIVWSSNSQCEHVYHKSCIEQWLMKGRDGPLCPCCRRDFVIDPLDSMSEEMGDLEKGTREAVRGNPRRMVPTSTLTSTRSIEIPSNLNNYNDAMIAMFLRASIANPVSVSTLTAATRDSERGEPATDGSLNPE